MGLQVLDAVVGLISFQWGKAAGTIIGLLIEAYIFVCVWSLRYEGEGLKDFYFVRFLFREIFILEIFILRDLCFRKQQQREDVWPKA